MRWNKLLLFTLLVLGVWLGWQAIPTIQAAPVATIVVNTDADVVSGIDGVCSLREAVIAANTNTGSGIVVGECPAGASDETDIIQLADNVTYMLTIAGSGEDNSLTGDLDVTNDTPDADVVVEVAGNGTAVVQSGAGDRVWHVLGAGFEMTGVEVRNGSGVSAGGGLMNQDGDVTLRNAIFSLNTAVAGGAIAMNGAEAVMTIRDSEVTRNNGGIGGHGGGVSNNQGTLILIDSTITGNNAQDDGGGLANTSGSVTMTRTRISSNKTDGCGGGAANLGTNGTMTLIESTITGVNEALGAGGGLCNEGTLSITQQSNIGPNEANAGGGGIYNKGILSVRNSSIGANEALDPDTDQDGLGGGVFAEAGSETMILQSAIVNNRAATAGGAVYTLGQLLMFNSTVSSNVGALTGGIFVGATGEATLVNVTLADNTAALALAGLSLHVLNGSVAVGNTILYSPDADTCTNSGGTLSSLGHNLSDDGSCFGDEGDVSNTDPLLGPLDDGFHDLQAGSPAVDAGDPVLCSETAVQNVDQVGQARPLFDGCDIGAIEWTGLQLYLPAITRG